MKKIFGIIFLFVLLQSCFVEMFYTKDRDGYDSESDFYMSDWSLKEKDYEYRLTFGIQHYPATDSTSYLKYRFEIYKYNYDTIKLNSISFSKKPNKDTIPITNILLYIESNKRFADTIKYLPLIIDKYKKKLTIIVEAPQQPCEMLKTLYVSYDIEVGDTHIVRNNVKYRRTLDWNR